MWLNHTGSPVRGCRATAERICLVLNRSSSCHSHWMSDCTQYLSTSARSSVPNAVCHDKPTPPLKLRPNNRGEVGCRRDMELAQQNGAVLKQRSFEIRGMTARPAGQVDAPGPRANDERQVRSVAEILDGYALH